MYLLFFILILVALIVVHELGHFSVAKFFGIRVDEFGVGFPPRLLAIKKGETEYSLNLLFFGGFVRIFGENPEDGKENGKSDPRSFARKPRLVQAAVIVAGIACNLLFAWLVLSAGYMYGMPTSADYGGPGTVSNVQTMIVGVMPGTPAEKSGLAEGDIVESIDTGTAKLAAGANSDTTREFIANHQNESLVVSVLRSGKEVHVLAKAESGIIPDRKALGVQLDDVGTLKLSPLAALREGASVTKNMTVETAKGLVGFFAHVFRGTANFNDVSGPIGIAGVGSRAIQHGLSAAITLTALISINLALINVLPIPGLDGGRLFLIALESVRRKTLSTKVTTALTVVGFAFLIGLMLLVSYHDVLKLLG